MAWADVLLNWVKTWQYGQAHSVVVNGVKCSWQTVTKGAL